MTNADVGSKREKRHREDDDDDRDRTRRRSHRHDDEREHEREDRSHDDRRRRHYDSDEERDRERRHRRRDREGDDDKRRSRDDRDDRSYSRDRSGRDRDRGRERDRSRHEDRHDRDRERVRDDDERSHRSSSRRDRDRSGSRDRERERRHRDDRDTERARVRAMTREEKERERERRDREMMEERREAARREGVSSLQFVRSQLTLQREYQSPRRRRSSPVRDEAADLLNEVDSEARSVFVSQLAASLKSSDLGLFFEDKLGPRTVRDARIINDRHSRRSRGIGYVELASTDLVSKALALSGTIVMGIPILVTLTDASSNPDGMNLGAILATLKAERRERRERIQQRRFPPLSPGLQHRLGVDVNAHAEAALPYHRLFVADLAEVLNAEDIRQVFEPFGEIEFVDLHTDVTGTSKGTAYIQFAELNSAQMALDAMNNFELADKTIKVMSVDPPRATRIEDEERGGGNGRRGGRLDAQGRVDLMYKLARRENPDEPSRSRAPPPQQQERVRPTTFLLVSNMFNPDEETERNWDTDLADDVKVEVENKYGHVARIKVDKMSNKGDVYIEFKNMEGAERAQRGLQGRFFGGRSLTAQYINEGLFKSHI